MISLELPWPPSVNTYWRHPTTGCLAGRHLISEKGRKYRSEVLACVSKRKADKTLNGRLSVHIMALPPDRRRRDIDNLGKAVLDSIVFSRVIDDDGLIDKLTIERGPISAPSGKIFITIEEL